MVGLSARDYKKLAFGRLKPDEVADLRGKYANDEVALQQITMVDGPRAWSEEKTDFLGRKKES